MNLQSKEEVKMKSVERLCLDGTLLGKSLLGGNFAWRRLFLEETLLGGDRNWWQLLPTDWAASLSSHSTRYTWATHWALLRYTEFHWATFESHWATLHYTPYAATQPDTLSYTWAPLSCTEFHLSYTELHWATLSHAWATLRSIWATLRNTDLHKGTLRSIEVHAVQAGGWENRKYCQTILQLFCSRAS